MSGQTILINESAAEQLGWGVENAVGEELVGSEVAAVLRDFHASSRRHEAEPVMLLLRDDGPLDYVVARFRAASAPSALEASREAWARLAPDEPFEGILLEDHIAEFYETEERTAHLVSRLAMITFLIGLSGVAGLNLYTTRSRRREIGIRRVLGADAWGIFTLLGRDLLPTVIVSGLLGCLIAAWIGRRWLDGFAESIPLHVPHLLIPLLIISFVSIAVTFTVVRGALRTPTAETIK